ncbi:MAG: DRTGG domain-containing protein [Armatimonadota bacterium]
MILLSKVADKLDLTSRVNKYADREVTGGYTSDLLSDVLANAKDGNIWVTNQKHQNCVAVASLLGISAVIIAGGIEPDDNTIEKAESEQVALFTTEASVFDTVGKLYEIGIRG